ncbi:MAG: transcription antitermination factor NusB [Bacteroidetes bacterium]|nr:transcription antitermination factor NusB [Bacteroidota bacterium]
MLSRRQLRIKVLQELYAFFQSKSDRIDLAEKQLLKSIGKLYELCFWQLSVLIEISDFAIVRMEEAKKKHFPTPEDLNPNTKFITNKFINLLKDNRVAQKKIDNLKISWVNEPSLIRKLYKQMIDHKIYSKYMSDETLSFEQDQDFAIKILKKIISKSDSLKYFYEDLSIYWHDDYHSVTSLVIKIIDSFNENVDEYHPLPTILKTKNEPDDEDVGFMKTLFRKTIIKSKEFEKLITDKAVNWDFDRIALIDIIILKMALAELFEFKSIPIKVTLNEYIEISKYYSTPKSSVFVNGILDKLIVELTESKQIKKAGRGLMN